MKGADPHLPPGNVQRSKRPAKLLPVQILYGDRLKNITELDFQNTKRPEFYDPSASCSDVSLLGYTLNGYSIHSI